jgi:hypothetical protein
MQKSRVIQILSLWPDRRSVHEDAAKARADLQMVAVHRWFGRGSIPSEYWSALLLGARARRIKLTAQDLADAHAACEQDGHSSVSVQPLTDCTKGQESLTSKGAA